MAHLYDKAPPAFAKDPWAWDYTRDRIEQNSGLTYDQWEGKHFAGSAAMYKNVVKKYRENVEQNNLDIPRECVDCGLTNAHYVDDYVCSSCRDALDAADTYEEAAATISNPQSIDQIREQLYKALGHDKKDAKKGRVPMLAEPGTIVNHVDETVTPIVASGVSRNYKAMGADKLAKCVAELEAGSGDAVKRAEAKGENVDDHLEAALRAQQES